MMEDSEKGPLYKFEVKVILTYNNFTKILMQLHNKGRGEKRFETYGWRRIIRTFAGVVLDIRRTNEEEGCDTNTDVVPYCCG